MSHESIEKISRWGALALWLLMVAAFLGAALTAIGCTTTRTLPDGTVEIEQLDPVALQAFVRLAEAALEVAQATHEADSPRNQALLADMLEMNQLVQAAQLILADGVTAEEQAQLAELYERAQEILSRNGVNLKLKVR